MNFCDYLGVVLILPVTSQMDKDFEGSSCDALANSYTSGVV